MEVSAWVLLGLEAQHKTPPAGVVCLFELCQAELSAALWLQRTQAKPGDAFQYHQIYFPHQAGLLTGGPLSAGVLVFLSTCYAFSTLQW